MGKNLRDKASYGIGQIYGERYAMVKRAADQGLLVGEEALSADYLQKEKANNWAY